MIVKNCPRSGSGRSLLPACSNRTDRIDVESSWGRKMFVPNCRARVFDVGSDGAYIPCTSEGFRAADMRSASGKEAADMNMYRLTPGCQRISKRI